MTGRYTGSRHPAKLLIPSTGGVAVNDLAVTVGDFQPLQDFLFTLNDTQPGNDLAHAEHAGIVERLGNFIVGE
jgi:hypothetical protein